MKKLIRKTKNQFSGMKKGLLKGTACLLAAATLLLSSPFFVWAKSSSSLTPGEYVFMTMLQACGIYSYGANGQWLSAYRGYLESTGNTAMLNRLNSYNSLSWGDNVAGMAELYNSLKGWLSYSNIYGTNGTNTRFYTLPSMPSPAPDKLTGSGQYSIRAVPFSDINSLPESGYDYLFSDVYYRIWNSRPAYMRRNLYKPTGVELFGITTSFDGLEDTVTVKYYKKDSAAEEGYSSLNVRTMISAYYVDDDQLAGQFSSSYTSDYIKTNVRSVMNLPFKVFSNVNDAKTYVETGVANNLFSKDKCSLWWYDSYGVNLELQKTTAIEVNDIMVLPPSNADAWAVYNNTAGNIRLDTITNRLKACGLDISFQADYTIEHYQRNLENTKWEKTDEEKITGIAAKEATFTAKEYPGFIVNEALTEPADRTILGDGSLIVKLYYNRKRLDYKVEHYIQNLSGNGWKKADEETLSGVYGADASYTPRSYQGHKYKSDLTEPEDPTIPADNNLTIKLYYPMLTPLENSVVSLGDSMGKIFHVSKDTLKGIIFIVIPIIVSILAIFWLIRYIKKLTNKA